MEAHPKTMPGLVVFLDAGQRFRNAVRVGALPDLRTFTPGGGKLLIVNKRDARNSDGFREKVRGEDRKLDAPAWWSECFPPIAFGAAEPFTGARGPVMARCGPSTG